MNKFNFLSLVAVICMASVFLSCKKEKEKEPGSSPVISINANVENISSISSKIDAVKAVVDPYWDFDEEIGPILTGGIPVASSSYTNRLSLDLPNNVSSIINLEYMFDDPPNGVKVSNKDVKGTTAFLLGYESESEIGLFLFVKPDNKGMIIVFADLVYVDSDVIITGSSTEKEGSKTYIEKFNVSLKTGWNYMFSSEEVSTDGKTITYNYTTTYPGGLKWYFIDYEFEVESTSAIKSKMSSGFKRLK